MHVLYITIFQSGLCSVINHDKRSGKAPRYSGELIPKIWGDDTGKSSIGFSGELVRCLC